jgi:ATP-dependent protease ClpP protease subunit
MTKPNVAKLQKDFFPFKEGAMIYSEPIAFAHTVFLDEYFEDKGYYQSVLNLMSNVSENDSITFILNNHGGSLDVLLPLINLLELTSAHTVALCTGSQSSAATIFAMYCDELVALDFSEFMIHEMQAGFGGTMSNVSRNADSSKKRNKRLVREAYGGFLSPEEIEDVLRGVEVYLCDEEINARWPSRKDWREEFFAQKQQTQQALMEQAMANQATQDAELEITEDVAQGIIEMLEPDSSPVRKPVAKRTRKTKE